MSYYFLDFSILERVGLWRRFLRNEWWGASIFREVETLHFTVQEPTVISLPYRLDRRDYIQAMFAAHQVSFEFFDATPGSDLEWNGDYFTRVSADNLTIGSKGCATSHIRLWEALAARRDGNENSLYLIFEDDIVLNKDFYQSINHQEFPRDLDILFLGGWNTRGRDMNYFVSPRVFSCYNPRKGLYAYAITATGANKLLQNCLPLDIIYGGLDTKIGKLVRQGKITAYHIYPPIVHVDLTFPSDIFNPSQPDKVLFKCP